MTRMALPAGFITLSCRHPERMLIVDAGLGQILHKLIFGLTASPSPLQPGTLPVILVFDKAKGIFFTSSTLTPDHNFRSKTAHLKSCVMAGSRLKSGVQQRVGNFHRKAANLCKQYWDRTPARFINTENDKVHPPQTTAMKSAFAGTSASSTKKTEALRMSCLHGSYKFKC